MAHILPLVLQIILCSKIVESHAMDIIDGSHLMSEEGLGMWIQHFAPATQGAVNTFKIDIPVS